MNDPHVEALIYVVEHDKSSDYSLAKAIEIEHTTFHLKLEDSEARFEFGYIGYRCCCLRHTQQG